MKNFFYKIKDKLQNLLDKFQETQLYQNLKNRYDELDYQQKLYLNLIGLGGGVIFFFVFFFSFLGGLASLKSEIDDKQLMTQYLQDSANQIRTLKATKLSARGPDLGLPLNQFIETLAQSAGLNTKTLDISKELEKPYEKDKNITEAEVDVKMQKTNLRAVTRLLFKITEQAKLKNLNVKNLQIDTKADPEGFLDATMTIVSYKRKE